MPLGIGHKVIAHRAASARGDPTLGIAYALAIVKCAHNLIGPDKTFLFK
jgi:hypothetical protein